MACSSTSIPLSGVLDRSKCRCVILYFLLFVSYRVSTMNGTNQANSSSVLFYSVEFSSWFGLMYLERLSFREILVWMNWVINIEVIIGTVNKLSELPNLNNTLQTNSTSRNWIIAVYVYTIYIGISSIYTSEVVMKYPAIRLSNNLKSNNT